MSGFPSGYEQYAELFENSALNQAMQPNFGYNPNQSSNQSPDQQQQGDQFQYGIPGVGGPPMGGAPSSAVGSYQVPRFIEDQFGREQPVSFLSDQVGSAALSDFENLREAEEFNRGRRDQEIEQMRGLLGQVGEQIQGTAATQAGMVRDQAAGARENIVSDIEAARDEYKTNLDESVAEFDKTTQMEMSAASAGIDRSTKAAVNQINSGMNADGTQMTPQQQQAARQELAFQNRSQRQSALAPMVGAYEQSMLGARMTAEGAKFGADVSTAQTKMNAYNMEAQAGQFAANLEQSAAVQATQYLVTGQQQMYDMVSANPYSPVALFDSMAAIYALQSGEIGMSPFERPAALRQEFMDQGFSGQIPGTNVGIV